MASALMAGGLNAEILPTRGPDDAAAFARKICAEQNEPLVIVGAGDGTINGVLNGLVPGAATLAVLPFGTSNVLARELGIRSIDDGVARVLRGASRWMSVGLMEVEGARRYFSLMAGAGFDGSIVEGVRGGEKRILKQGAYILSALRVLARWDAEPLEVVADGKRIGCHSVIVCNAARYGGSFVLARGADLFEPRFEVVCVRSANRAAYLRLALKCITGRNIRGDDVTVFPAGEVEIRGGKPVQLDGDYVCRTPIHIRAVENFVRVIT